SMHRLGELHPLLDPRIELISGDILGSDEAGLVPVAGECVSKREILTDRRVGIDLPGRRLEHRDRLLRMAGESQGEAVIRRIENSLSRVQKPDSLAILALRDLDERQLQDGLRLVRIERESILVRGLRRRKS